MLSSPFTRRRERDAVQKIIDKFRVDDFPLKFKITVEEEENLGIYVLIQTSFTTKGPKVFAGTSKIPALELMSLPEPEERLHRIIVELTVMAVDHCMTWFGEAVWARA